MRSPVDKSCAVCGQPIKSVLESGFCSECGNPIHEACIGKTAVEAGRCSVCGGDPADPAAQRERDFQAEREGRAARQQEGRLQQYRERPAGAGVPVSKACPACGSSKYRTVKASRTVAFANDRVCSDCGTRYAPPTPVWAAVVFILVGLLLGGIGALGILLRVASGNPGMVPGMVCEGLLGLMGLLALIHGIKSLAKPGDV